MAKKKAEVGTDESANVNSGEKVAFSRNPEMEKHFLDLLLREVNAERYKGVSLTTNSWKRLRKEFNERWGVNYDHKKLRNHYDYLRIDFSTWIKLVDTSEHGQSGVTESLIWPPQKWKEVIEQNPKVAKFRNTPLKNFELLQAIFEGTLAQGKHARSNTPLDAPANPSQAQMDKYVDLDDDIHKNNEYFNGVKIVDDSSAPDVEIVKTQPSKSEAEPSKKKRRRNNQVVDEQIESFIEVLKGQMANEAAIKGPTLAEVLVPLRDLLNLDVITQPQFNRAKIAFSRKLDLMIAFLESKNEAEMVEFLYFIPNVM